MGSVIGYQEAHGPVATFETDVVENIKSLVVDINPVQSGTGDPSPDNVRPITGWTGVKATRCGKNLLNPGVYGNALPFTTNGLTFTKNSDNTIHVSGTATARTYYNATFVGYGTTKTLNAAPFIGRRMWFTGKAIDGVTYAVGYGRADGTFTTLANGSAIPSDAGFIRCYAAFAAGTTLDTDLDLMLEVGDAATEFVPPVPLVTNIVLPTEAGTVYGGTLDAVNGVLTVDRAMVKISELAWTYMAYYAYMATESLINVIGRPTSNANTLEGLLCSAYKTATAQQAGSGNVNETIAVNVNGELRIKDNSYTDSNEWKTAQGNQTIVYPLATPLTYQLTPQEISTIIGTNTIYADTGDTSVIYPKTIAPVETVSNVNLMELRRNIIAAQTYGKTVDVVLNLGTHQVYPTDSIESLRKYLTVVSRGSGATVTDYTLRGGIGTIGDNQIIIDCHPGIATIQVPVVANPTGILYEWDFTKSLTDERQNYTAILKTGEADEVPGKSEGTTPPVRGDTGVVFNDAQQVLRLLDSNIQSCILLKEKTVQIDVAYFNFIYNNTSTNRERARFIMFGDPVGQNGSMLYTTGIKLYDNWNWYFIEQPREGMTIKTESALLTGKNAISGHTIGIYINSSRTISFYVDGVYKGTTANSLPTDLMGFQIGAGGRPQYGGAFYDARITGVRIYSGQVTQ